MMFRSRASEVEEPPAPSALVGVGASFRGTLMVHGTLRIDGEFEGDILDCDRLEIGEHGLMRADVEVKEAMIRGRVHGNIRALGSLEMKQGAHVEGDVAAVTVLMEAGVYFTGRCTMLDTGTEGVLIQTESTRSRG
jgi:cytoskeletal protein CcmA (bactofilin family)